MHLFNMSTVFVVLTLVGVEFSVSAFVNPAAWRLEPESQLKMLSRFALVLGKVMPVWYPVATLLLVSRPGSVGSRPGAQSCLQRMRSGFLLRWRRSLSWFHSIVV
jgi:hypothetical protein